MDPSSSVFMKRLGTLVVLLLIAVASWAVNLQYKDVDLDKLAYSATTISIFYLLFKVFLEEVVGRKIRESRARYVFRKTTSTLFLVISSIIIIRIWIINPQALLVAYGLVAAGVAIALQDLFKNFAGGIVLAVTGLYRIGNRIEINGKFGDVMDIGMMYTTLLEIREWVDGDQATGRITLIPNGMVLSGPVHNYTREHHYLWDEISIPVTYDSDWKKAASLMTRIAAKETSELSKAAKKSLSRLEEKYYLSDRPTEPNVFVSSTDNWIMLQLRYIVDARERRQFKSALSIKLLEEIQNAPDIRIASATLTVTTVSPPLKWQAKK